MKRRCCRTCEHWGTTRDGFGQCQMVVSRQGVPLRKTLAYAIAVEGSVAGLVTKPDFYCSQYEART